MLCHHVKKWSIDKILVVAALAALVIAVLFIPKKEFKLGKTEIVLAIPPGGIINIEDFDVLAREFETENHSIDVHIAENSENSENSGSFPPENADIVIFDPLSLASPLENGLFEDEKPLVGGINALFYNISHLQELGFDRPPKTRDDFLSVCKKLKEGEASGNGQRYPFSFSENIFHSVFPWFYQTGTGFANPEEPLNIDWTSRGSIETFVFFRTLSEEKIVDSASLDRSEDEIVEDFIAGKCAMMIASVFNIKKIEEANPELDFNITTIPAPSNYKGKAVFNLSVLDIAVAKNSGHKEEAAIFLRYIDKKRGGIAASMGMISGNLRENLKRNPILEKAVDLYEASSIIDESKSLDNPKIVAERLKAELKKMLNGTQTPQQSAAGVGSREGAIYYSW
jgi:multiple sugar transport system substrate-binding protein